VFLAHFTGGGIDSVLDLETVDFWAYLDAAMEFYKAERQGIWRVALAGIEK
jgi:hypothetical protein